MGLNKIIEAVAILAILAVGAVSFGQCRLHSYIF